MRMLRRGDRILVAGVTGIEPGVFSAHNVVVDYHPAASPGYPYRDREWR